MKRIKELESKSWSSEGSHIWQLSVIPKEIGGEPAYVDALLIEAILDVTTDAGGGYSPEEQRRLFFQSITLQAAGHTFINGVNGNDLYHLLYSAEGVPQGGGESVAASQTNAKVKLVFLIPFSHPMLKEPSELGIPASLLADNGSLQIRYGSDTPNANTTINSATVTVILVMSRRSKLVVPPLPVINAINDDLSTELPDGAYLGLTLGTQDDSAFGTAGDVSEINLRAGNERIVDNVSTARHLWGYAYSQAIQGSVLVGSSMILGDTYWTDNYASIERIPLIYLSMVPKAGLTDLPDTLGGKLIVDCEGSLSSARYVYHLLEAQTKGRVQRAADRVGRPGAVAVPKTLNGKLPNTQDRKKPGMRVLPVILR